MKNPVIADNKPLAIDLEKDKEYYFCSCGLSVSQPFCDGSHTTTPFKPKAFVTLSEETKTALAQGVELAGTGGHLPGNKKHW